MEKKKFELKNNSGTLFLNERKTETKHPDYTGKALIFNKPCWISAWIKISQKGTKYISVAITEPLQKPKPINKDFETTQETFDEGYGEPDFNKKVDEFANKKNNYDDEEGVPF